MPKKVALLIGNGTFEDSTFQALARPPADVDALRRVLSNSAIGGFDEVTPLVDADSVTVRKLIAALYKNRASDDVLLLFYAGHGVKDEFGELHLITRDTANDALSATGIDASYLAREMDRSRSNNQILILDCCFSGAFADARGAEAGSVGARDSFTGNGTGRVILTASDAFEYAWEHESGLTGPNSVFTSFLVQGLESGEADRDGDGIITVNEWYDYVYDQMQRSTRRQTPQRTVAGAGSVVIATSPRPPVELEPDLAAMIRNAYPRAREAAVHELARLLFGNDRALVNAAREHLLRLSRDSDRTVRHLAKNALEGRLEPSGEKPLPPQPEPTPVPPPRPKPLPAPPQPLPARPPVPQPYVPRAHPRVAAQSPLVVGCGITAVAGGAFMAFGSIALIVDGDSTGVFALLFGGVAFLLGLLMLVIKPKSS